MRSGDVLAHKSRVRRQPTRNVKYPSDYAPFQRKDLYVIPSVTKALRGVSEPTAEEKALLETLRNPGEPSKEAIAVFERRKAEVDAAMLAARENHYLLRQQKAREKNRRAHLKQMAAAMVAKARQENLKTETPEVLTEIGVTV